MKKLLVLVLLMTYGSLTACSTSKSDINPAPDEIITASSPTIAAIQPTDTPGKQAIVTDTPIVKPSNTPGAPPSRTPTTVEETAYPGNRVVTETLVLEYDPNETNWMYMTGSPDGYRLANKKFKGDDQFVVIEGNEYGPYDDLSMLYFSADSQHLAFVASLGDKQFVVLDGVEQSYYDEIKTPSSSDSKVVEFSPDGQRVAYVAMKNQKPLVVVDGEEFSYDSISFPIVFSPDSQRVAFVAKNLNAEAFIVVDGEERRIL